MKSFGVRNLKNNLSEVLRDVKAGETVLVTEHGRVIAELRPSKLADETKPPIQRWLEHQSELGCVELPKNPAAKWEWPAPVEGGGVTWQELLDEERGHR